MVYGDELETGFSRLAEIAKEAGCEQYVADERAKVKELVDREVLRVIVTGGSNTGKSMLINRMVSGEVAEESMLADEDSMPLRVCFERTNDDERYRCVNILNGAWNDIGAEIYEFHFRDIKDSSIIDDKDFVLFTVSATTPFSGVDINALKELSAFHRQVVLTGIDYVQDKEREKVVDYARKINDSLGLPPIVVFENSDEQNIGKVIRGVLPAPNELNRLRAEHGRAIFVRTASNVAVALGQAVKDSELQQEKIARESQERAKRSHRSWGELYNSAVQRQVKASDEITMNITLELRKILSGLMDEGKKENYRDSWVAGLKSEVPDRVSALVDKKLDALEDTYAKDLRSITSDAEFMKLESFSFVDKPQESEEHSVRFDASVNMRAKNYGALIVAGVAAGLAAGAFALTRMPMAARVAGSVAAIAGGTVFAEKRQTGDRAARVEDKFSSQIPMMATDVDATLREASKKRYEPLISYIRSEYNSADKTGEFSSKSNQRKEYLEGLISECNHMKGE